MTHESRMLRITAWLVGMGIFDEVELVGVLSPGLPPVEVVDGQRRIVRIPQWGHSIRPAALSKLIRHGSWLVRVFSRYWRVRVDCVNCHSLTTLPLCVALKLATRAKLIYDTHELETETVSAGRVRKVLSRWVESACMPFVDKTVVVGEEIGRWYRNAYAGRPVHVVRNTPPRGSDAHRSGRRLRDALGMSDDEMLFVYLGLFGHGRGLEKLVEVFRGIPSRHIVFIGDGELAPMIDEAARVYPNVHRLPMVPPSEIGAWACGADVGISMIEPVSLSYYYSLPNKFFEYIQGGLPCLINNLPEQRAIVEEYRCGWVAPEEVADLARFVGSIDRTQVESMRAGALAARSGLCWENESRRLCEVYDIAGSDLPGRTTPRLEGPT